MIIVLATSSDMSVSVREREIQQKFGTYTVSPEHVEPYLPLPAVNADIVKVPRQGRVRGFRVKQGVG